MGWLRAFGGFWAGFVLGDDPALAAAVVAGLAATGGLVALGVPAWWLLPGVVAAATAASLRRAVRRGG